MNISRKNFLVGAAATAITAPTVHGASLGGAMGRTRGLLGGCFTGCMMAQNRGDDWGGQTVMSVAVAENGFTASFTASPSTVTIDWGDGIVDTSRSHSYASAGDYTVKIGRDCTSFDIGSTTKPLVTALLNCGENVATLSQTQFMGCTAMTSVSGLDSVVTIGRNSFRNCTSLSQDLVFANATTINGDTSSSDAGFARNSAITGLDLPKCVTIGQASLYQMNYVKYVNAPIATSMSSSPSWMSNLETFNAWSIERVTTSQPFRGCPKLSNAKLGLLTAFRVWTENSGGSVPTNKYGTKIMLFVQNTMDSIRSIKDGYLGSATVVCSDGWLNENGMTKTAWASVSNLPDNGDSHYTYAIGGKNYRWNDATSQYDEVA